MLYPATESSTLEFKATVPKNKQILKTIIGFCNQLGGRLIIGVDDNGLIKGLPEREVKYLLENLDKHIFQSTSPPIIPRIYAQTFNSQTIVVIEVASGMNKPYYLTRKGIDTGTYIRLGRSTMSATADIIEELRWSSKGLSYDGLPLYHATLEDLDLKKIEDFLKSRKNSENISAPLDDALKAYNLTIEIHAQTYPTVGGILLFGKNPQQFLQDAFIICSRFAGVEGRDTIATRDCLGTIFEQFHEAYQFVLSKLDRSFVVDASTRKEEYELPEIALKEALVNAVMHRNYHVRSPIKVAIFDNRIEIFSPGGFPGPLNDDAYHLGLTFTRNGVISKVFREAGYSERLGTGLRTILSQYASRGLEKPIIREGINFVKYILPRPEMAKQRSQVDDDQLTVILRLFDTATEITMGDITEGLSIPRTTANRRMALLVEKGLVRKKGKGRGTSYILARTTKD